MRRSLCLSFSFSPFDLLRSASIARCFSSKGLRSQSTSRFDNKQHACRPITLFADDISAKRSFDRSRSALSTDFPETPGRQHATAAVAMLPSYTQDEIEPEFRRGQSQELRNSLRFEHFIKYDVNSSINPYIWKTILSVQIGVFRVRPLFHLLKWFKKFIKILGYTFKFVE